MSYINFYEKEYNDGKINLDEMSKKRQYYNSLDAGEKSTIDKKYLSNHYTGLEVLGPAACFKEKIKNNFRFQIILKSIKKYDSSGKRLHAFINDNFIQNKNNYTGSNKIRIHIDPLSMI